MLTLGCRGVAAEDISCCQRIPLVETALGDRTNISRSQGPRVRLSAAARPHSVQGNVAALVVANRLRPVLHLGNCLFDEGWLDAHGCASEARHVSKLRFEFVFQRHTPVHLAPQEIVQGIQVR
jgi:hypothetical protein